MPTCIASTHTVSTCFRPTTRAMSAGNSMHRPRPEVIHEFAAVRVVEGNNGLGFEPSRIAMGGAIESARTSGSVLQRSADPITSASQATGRVRLSLQE